MKLPYIFIFDLNYTIIGDPLYINHELELLYIIHKYCKINNILNDCNNNFNVINELNDGLLRPYFKDFIQFIKTKYDNIELYIYTSKYQSYKWVHSGIITNIEKIIDIKFNKPYFTREDNINNKQEIDYIYDIIIDNLKSKYPLLKKDKYKDIVFNNQLIYINNSKSYLYNSWEKQITLPIYNFNNYYNIIEKIKDKYKINQDILNNEELLKYCDEHNIPIYSKKGSILQKEKSFQNILNDIIKLENKITYDNIKYNEKIFQILHSIMKSFKSLSLNNKRIQTINNKLLI
jgi:hypothetical protein